MDLLIVKLKILCFLVSSLWAFKSQPLANIAMITLRKPLIALRFEFDS